MREPHRSFEPAALPLAALRQPATVPVPPARAAMVLAASVGACVAAGEVVLSTGVGAVPWLGFYALLVLVPLVTWAGAVAAAMHRSLRRTMAHQANVQMGKQAPVPPLVIAMMLALPLLVRLDIGRGMRLALLTAAGGVCALMLARLVNGWNARARTGLVAVGLSDDDRQKLDAYASEIDDPTQDPRSYDRIYAAADAWADRQWHPFLARAGLRDVPVASTGDLAERLSGCVDIDAVDATRRAAITAGVAQGRGAAVVERTMDIAISLCGMIALSPIILLTAAVVMVAMGRPVLFVQPRVGRGGRVFKMVKFRSMRVNGDANVIATANGDARVTPAGRLLRRSRLDELPQLWNILVGDMTLIGPRPEQPALAERYAKLIPNYDLRHLVKPGLTGWAQVRYGYAATVAETRGKLGYDLYYVAHKGLLLDLQILVRTVGALCDGNLVR